MFDIESESVVCARRLEQAFADHVGGRATALNDVDGQSSSVYERLFRAGSVIEQLRLG